MIRAHKLTLESLWAVLWIRFKDWAAEHDKIISHTLTEAAGRVVQGFSDQDDEQISMSLTDLLSEVRQVSGLFDELEASHTDDGTFMFWRTYMRLVSILLRFTRSLRDGDWDLFLSSFSEKLPWFGAFDHVNYTRWATVFLARPHQLSVFTQSS